MVHYELTKKQAKNEDGRTTEYLHPCNHRKEVLEPDSMGS